MLSQPFKTPRKMLYITDATSQSYTAQLYTTDGVYAWQEESFSERIPLHDIWQKEIELEAHNKFQAIEYGTIASYYVDESISDFMTILINRQQIYLAMCNTCTPYLINEDLNFHKRFQSTTAKIQEEADKMISCFNSLENKHIFCWPDEKQQFCNIVDFVKEQKIQKEQTKLENRLQNISNPTLRELLKIIWEYYDDDCIEIKEVTFSIRT